MALRIANPPRNIKRAAAAFNRAMPQQRSAFNTSSNDLITKRASISNCQYYNHGHYFQAIIALPKSHHHPRYLFFSRSDRDEK
mmetsp:Transcript_1726/g.3243  ORF Transcript_1726/g.3243 Transcript_1726/m.3243 type:complete len:83 (+) Transcript_1726:2-250(+)